jgi:hypothetical protein
MHTDAYQFVFCKKSSADIKVENPRSCENNTDAVALSYGNEAADGSDQSCAKQWRRR